MNVDGFAQLLTEYCLEVTPGQQVLVQSSSLAAPLLLALQREILERDAWPLIRASLPGQDEGFWSAARDVHLDGYATAELAEAEQIDASLRIQATENANALAGVDPARLSRAAISRAPLREVALSRRWAITLFPTAAAAQQAGMGTARVRGLRHARAVPGPRGPRRRLGRATRVPGGADRAARSRASRSTSRRPART